MNQKSVLRLVLFGLVALLLMANVSGVIAGTAQTQPQTPPEQKVDMGNGYWLVTNSQNGQFIRVEMSTNDPSQTQMSGQIIPVDVTVNNPSQTQPQTPLEQKVDMGNGNWLITNSQNGQFIRVEMSKR